MKYATFTRVDFGKMVKTFEAMERGEVRQARLAFAIEGGFLPDNPLEWILARAWERWSALKGIQG